MLISLAMFPGMLGGVAAPGSLLYRHPMYDLRWWWREFGRVSYIGGREYHRPSLLSIERQYPVFGETIDATSGHSIKTVINEKENVQSLLFRHDREKEWEFWNRKNRAYYSNFVRTVCNSLVSHATNNAAARTADTLMEDYWNGVDRKRRTPISQFVRYGMTQAEVQGMLWAVTDVDPKGDNKPYSYWVSSLDVLDWDVSEDGTIKWLKQFIYIENQRTWEQQVVPRFRFRIWSTENVVTYETNTVGGDKKTISTVKNETGVVPWTPLYSIKDEEALFPDGIARMGDFCKGANHVYNLTSLVSEIFYKQTFSWLAIPDKNVDTLQMGVCTAFGYDPQGTSAKPEYLSPDPRQAEVLMTGISNTLEQARQSIGVGRGRSEGSMVKQSADALELESEDKRSILYDMAESAQDFERRLSDVVQSYRTPGVAAVKGKTVIQYPTDFNLRSLQAEIDEATSLKNLTVSPEVNLAALEQIVRRKFANLPPNDLSALVKTLEDASKKAQAQADAMSSLRLKAAAAPPAAGAKPGEPGAGGVPPQKPDPGELAGADPDVTAQGDA